MSIENENETEIGFTVPDDATTFIIPEGVTSIPEKAFSSCDSLKSVIIPISVTSINERAFEGCEELKSITIPENVSNIDKTAFYGCFELSDLSVDPKNQFYSSLEGVLFNADRTELVIYPKGKANREYSVPDGVVKIGDNAFDIENGGFLLEKLSLPDSLVSIGKLAFEFCESLMSITIPGNVTDIGESAITDCESLESVCISASVVNIGEYMFIGCSGLTDIHVDSHNKYYSSLNGVFFNKEKTKLINYPEGKQAEEYIIPDGVIDIGNNAFSNVRSLTKVTLPDSINRIGDGAFIGCYALSDINIPLNTTSLGSGAFSYCESLVSIAIPENVSVIENDAFSDCTGLITVNVSETSKYYCGLNGVLFDYNKKRLIKYPSKKQESNYSIPDSVISIGKEAFSACSFLEYVTIPDSVISIEESAFDYCELLTSIRIPDSVTSISGNVFSECTKLAAIEVDSPNAFYYSADGVLFNADKTALIAYPESKPGETYCIPDSVTSIGPLAFTGYKILKSITIPDSVANIDLNAFINIYSDEGEDLVVHCSNISIANAYCIENGMTVANDL